MSHVQSVTAKMAAVDGPSVVCRVPLKNVPGSWGPLHVLALITLSTLPPLIPQTPLVLHLPEKMVKTQDGTENKEKKIIVRENLLHRYGGLNSPQTSSPSPWGRCTPRPPPLKHHRQCVICRKHSLAEHLLHFYLHCSHVEKGAGIICSFTPVSPPLMEDHTIKLITAPSGHINPPRSPPSAVGSEKDNSIVG